MHNLFVHIMPGLFHLVNFLSSDVILELSHLPVYLIPFLAYNYLNYLESMRLGRALYSFLDWPNDFSGSMRNMIGILIWTIVVYAILVVVIRWIKSDFVQKTTDK